MGAQAGIAILQLGPKKQDNESALLRTFACEQDYKTLISKSTKVLREDGSTLCILLKKAISLEAGSAMYRAIRDKIAFTDNRGTASGQESVKRKKKDGTLQKRARSPQVQSSIMGYFDRNPAFPYCRQAAFNVTHPQAFNACLPALAEASALFAKHEPKRFAAQNAVCQQSSQDFVIPNTVFTTITLNRNFRTGYHRDAGDLASGFGVMSYYRGGRFNGGHLVFPSYAIALQLDSLDLVLFDPHEIHGNTEIKPLREGWERITCVHYYRENMHFCGSTAEELRLAQSHDPRQGARSMRAKAKKAHEST